MTIACIILAHQLPNQLASLIGALRHPQVRVYLHVDRRKSLAPFTQALEEAGLDDVVPLRRHVSHWGGANCVDAALEGVAAGVADGCDYVILISGQDFPLRPADEIVAFLETAASRSYVSYMPVEESTAGQRGQAWHGRHRTEFYTYTVRGLRELCVPRGEDTSFLSRRGRILNELLRLRSSLHGKRRHPSYAQPFTGASWWNLSRPAADYVLRFVDEHPDYRRYHEYTMAPDELFFQTILVGTDFANNYEVINDDLRYVNWPDGAPHPLTLTTRDLPAMLQSGKLFARKFDRNVDDAVIRELAERVGTRSRAG
jgi:hypothetical protein